MPSFVDHAVAQKSGRNVSQRLRRSLHATPRLEFLETRCLMSGGRPRIARDIDARLPIRGAAIANQPVASDLLHHRIAPPYRNDADRDARLVTRDNGPRSEYGGSASDAWTSPVVPGMPKAPYVLVFEAKGPHQTFATAQGLPRVPYFGVVGTINPGDPIDLYRLTLGTSVNSLDFALRSDQSTPAGPLQLQLFDGSGQLLRNWSVDGQNIQPLNADLGDLPAGTTVFLGVSAGSLSEQARASAPLDYQLWVSLRSSTEPVTIAPAAGTIVPTSALAPVIASPLLASINSTVQSSRAASEAARAVTPSPSESDASRVAVGSAAVRSARPAGGLLSDGEAAPPAARDFSASVNKEWDDGALAASAPRQRAEIEPSALAARENESAALVVVPGPSGFPLMGAVAIGHRRSSPAANVGDFTTPRAIADTDAELPAGAAVQTPTVLANLDNRVTTPDDDTAQSGSLAVGDWPELPAPVYSSLGLATAFTLNAVFSQPIGGFDYLVSRLDALRGTLTNPKTRRPTTQPASHRR
jgi:hypothetical protein